ncbi:MAG: hypothetical protein LBD75_02975 [Candidatus Peribacteria bacterium]|nr:hypothetical protein [Candidatus Peribacteria bacterium]
MDGLPVSYIVNKLVDNTKVNATLNISLNGVPIFSNTREELYKRQNPNLEAILELPSDEYHIM